MLEESRIRGMLLALSRSPRKLSDLAKSLALSEEEVGEIIDSIVREGLAVYISDKPFPTLRGFYLICRQGELLDIVARLSETPSSERSLSKSLGISRKRLKHMLNILQIEGFVNRKGRRYTITRAGERWAMKVLEEGCPAGLPGDEPRATQLGTATQRLGPSRDIEVPQGDLVRVRINPHPISSPILVSPAVVKDEMSDVEILYGGILKLFRSGVYFEGYAVTGKWLAKFTKKGKIWTFFLPSRSIKTIKIVKRRFRGRRLLLEGISLEGKALRVVVVLDPDYVKKYLIGTALASTFLPGGEVVEMLDLPDFIGDALASGSHDVYEVWERALSLVRR